MIPTHLRSIKIIEMEASRNEVHQHEDSTHQPEILKKSSKLSIDNNKKQREEFKFGNYRNYYTKRLGAGEQPTDFRLELLSAHPECFRDKKVLDIGCNSGFVTINFAKQMLPTSVLGIDIDGSLIDRARSELEKEKSEDKCSLREKEALDRVTFRKVRQKIARFFNIFILVVTGKLHLKG